MIALLPEIDRIDNLFPARKTASGRVAEEAGIGSVTPDAKHIKICPIPTYNI
jgi:hypothetical protein